MEVSRMVAACDANAQAALRHFIGTSGGTLVEVEGALLAASPDPYCGTFHNAVTRVDHHAPAHSVLHNATAFFTARRRGFILWTTEGRDEDLETAAHDFGLRPRAPGNGSAGMVRSAPVADIAPPRGIEVRVVRGVGQVTDFATVVGEAYSARDGAEPPPETLPHAGFRSAARTMFNRPASLLGPHTDGVIAYRDGVPVSCAMTLRSGHVAGLYWVSTIAGERGHGLGALVTARAVNRAFEHGAQHLVLQASDMGAGIYRRMGFTRITWHRRYVSAGRLERPSRADRRQLTSASRNLHR